MSISARRGCLIAAATVAIADLQPQGAAQAAVTRVLVADLTVAFCDGAKGVEDAGACIVITGVGRPFRWRRHP
ncbi:MAG TPA: hypothetical protein VE687_20155 [Stellaceae bacterium]|nr:hypothetical protein [Stellaceae bacterium]